MSRTATGWIPSRSGKDTAIGQEAEDDCEESPELELATTPTTLIGDSPPTPMGSQREADEQRMAWGQQWATGKVVEQPHWTLVVAQQIPLLTIQAFEQACTSFPASIGLGWDNIHPRALSRLPKRLQQQLVEVLMAAELYGS